MSEEDLALFLRRKMGEKRANNKEMIKSIDISRRTWYRLINADIKEAKLSTLIKLASTLDVSVTELIHIYFSKHSSGTKPDNKKIILHTNIPNNSLIKSNKVFNKTWEVKNRSTENWHNMTLQCIDQSLNVTDKTTGVQYTSSILEAQHQTIIVPDTKKHGIAHISIQFTAPSQQGAIISHWRFFKEGKPMTGKAYPLLSCLVQVV